MNDSFKKRFWISAGLIIVTVIAAAGAISFLVTDIQASSGQIVKYRSAVAVNDASLSDAAQLKADAGTAATYATAMGQLLPSQDNLISFPQMVDTIARSYGLTDQVSFTGNAVPPTATAAGSIAFSMQVAGPSADCISFLKNIESKSDQFIIHVTSFNLSGSGSQSNLAIGGNVFFQ